MRIVNTEILVPKINEPNSEYFEKFLNEKGLKYLRWAIVNVGETEYTLNVSHLV